MEIIENPTRRRLEQVKILFYQMRKEFGDGDLEGYEISLNNFIINSRSITFLLQKEFGKNKDFQSWYAPKKEEMKNKGYEKFVDMRNQLQKEGDLRKAVLLHINVTSPKEKGSRILTEEIDENGKKKNPIYGKFENKPFFGIEDLDFHNLNKTAITECRDYLNYLTSLVEEAYLKFLKKHPPTKRNSLNLTRKFSRSRRTQSSP